MVITATAPLPGPTVLQLWGPVRVECGDRMVEPGGPRERTVLAALALAQGRPVSVDRLLEWLWDEQPPPSGAQVGAERRVAASAAPGYGRGGGRARRGR